MAKFNLTATVNTSLAGTTLTGAEGLGTTLSGQQGFTVGVLNGVGPTGPTGPTGDQGPQGIQGIQGPQGIQGIQGPTGAGFTGGSYDSSNGTVTFTSDDNLGFSTGDLRGADGTGSGTVTSVGTGGGLTGGPVTSSGTISHADTSTQANITATANTYIDGMTFDTYGHVTGVTTSSATFDGLSDTDVTGRAAGEFVRYSGANYVSSSLTEDINGNVTVNGDLEATGTIEDSIGDVRKVDVSTTTDTSFTIPSNSSGKLYRLVSSTTSTVNVDGNNFTIGEVVTVCNIGGGTITLSFSNWSNGARVAGGDGTDLNGTSTLEIESYGLATLVAVSANRLVVNGNVS